MQADASHDVHGEVDQMRKIRIKPDKLIFVELRAAGALFELDILHQRRTTLPEQLPEDTLLALLLAQHTAGGGLADAGGRQVDQVFERVLRIRQVDAATGEAVVDLWQSFLGRNDD